MAAAVEEVEEMVEVAADKTVGDVGGDGSVANEASEGATTVGV